jgi:hypothetical protein
MDFPGHEEAISILNEAARKLEELEYRVVVTRRDQKQEKSGIRFPPDEEHYFEAALSADKYLR